ncbi:hypothetical protein BT96DRAFT_982367 [Gymnopus androsaceus JB14]|uniref:Uncharacterized protein n=1 Tax=Gymnopus androsaceus JB14 TaxID=1447944 RepID=A0A6A4GFD7_9AGAR|nr:hypothetical protein BT96DRAFT_982367 [Gymnopus androsaceus JB14]
MTSCTICGSFLSIWCIRCHNASSVAEPDPCQYSNPLLSEGHPTPSQYSSAPSTACSIFPSQSGQQLDLLWHAEVASSMYSLQSQKWSGSQSALAYTQDDLHLAHPSPTSMLSLQSPGPSPSLTQGTSSHFDYQSLAYTLNDLSPAHSSTPSMISSSPAPSLAQSASSSSMYFPPSESSVAHTPSNPPPAQFTGSPVHLNHMRMVSSSSAAPSFTQGITSHYNYPSLAYTSNDSLAQSRAPSMILSSLAPSLTQSASSTSMYFPPSGSSVAHTPSNPPPAQFTGSPLPLPMGPSSLTHPSHPHVHDITIVASTIIITIVHPGYLITLRLPIFGVHAEWSIPSPVQRSVHDIFIAGTIVDPERIFVQHVLPSIRIVGGAHTQQSTPSPVHRITIAAPNGPTFVDPKKTFPL